MLVGAILAAGVWSAAACHGAMKWSEEGRRGRSSLGGRRLASLDDDLSRARGPWRPSRANSWFWHLTRSVPGGLHRAVGGGWTAGWRGDRAGRNPLLMAPPSPPPPTREGPTVDRALLNVITGHSQWPPPGTLPPAYTQQTLLWTPILSLFNITGQQAFKTPSPNVKRPRQTLHSLQSSQPSCPPLGCPPPPPTHRPTSGGLLLWPRFHYLYRPRCWGGSVC